MSKCLGITGSFKTGSIKRCKKQVGDKFFCRHHKRQPIYWIFVLIFVVLAGGASIYSAFIKDHQSAETFQDYEKESKLEAFQKETFGILVAAFNRESEEQFIKSKEIQGSIVSTLNAIFRESKITDTKARKIPLSINLGNHEDAREIGKNYNADIVIWGNVTIVGYIPHLTIVDPLSHVAAIVKSDADLSILKNSLTHESLKNITDIRLPAFTEEPVSLSLFATGLKHLKDEKYDEALRYLQESLPKNASQYIDSADIYGFIGLVPLISEIFRKEYVEGMMYAITGRADQAISVLNKGIIKNKNEPQLYVARGMAYMQKKEFDKAISDFNKTEEIDPKHGLLILEERGICYFNVGSYGNAISDFSKYLEFIPASPEFGPNLYIYRGMAYERLGNYGSAMSDYDKVVQENPKNVQALVRRGLLYFHKGQCEQAISDFNEAIMIRPKTSEAYYRKALCHEKMGQPDEAINAYKDFLNYASSDEFLFITFAHRRLNVLKKSNE